MCIKRKTVCGEGAEGCWVNRWDLQHRARVRVRFQLVERVCHVHHPGLSELRHQVLHLRQQVLHFFRGLRHSMLRGWGLLHFFVSFHLFSCCSRRLAEEKVNGRIFNFSGFRHFPDSDIFRIQTFPWKCPQPLSPRCRTPMKRGQRVNRRWWEHDWSCSRTTWTTLSHSFTGSSQAQE